MTNYRKHPLLLVLMLTTLAWLGVVSPARALDPDKAFDHYVRNAWSIQSGLPQISVQAVAQDRQGYIWVGTQAGVARFDGIRFTTYKQETDPALPGNWTRTLLVDARGRVWIGTYKGLAVYENGKFRSVPPADPTRYPDPDIFALAPGPDGAMIAATSDGVFDVRAGRLVHREGSPAPAQSLLQRADGLWIGSLGGAYRLDGAHTEFLALPPEASNASVTRLREAQGKIWAGTTLGLYFRSGDQWQLASENAALVHSPVTMLFEDHDKNLWVGSNAGLSRFRDGALVEFVPERSPGAFHGVISAFEDRENNLWLGSQWEGVARIWNGWTRRYSAAEGLDEAIVWSLSKAPDGKVWVGTNDGLSVLDNGHFQKVLNGDQLPHPQAYNLLAEADRVWIGTRRGLAIWRDNKVETPPLFAPMASAQINGIVPDSHGVYWFPTTEGLFRLADNTLRRYGHDEGLADVRVRQVRELRDGRLLVGTQDGLYELRNDRLVPLGLDTGLHPGMDITAIDELANGEWVIGTFAEELYLFDGHTWQEFGRQQGLPANAPFFLAEDDAGFLWIAGFRGIARVPLAEMHSLQRGKIDTVHAEMVLNERGDRLSGQQGFCCNGAGTSKGYIDHDVLWLPSRDGVVALDTRGIVKNKVPPNVVVERVQYQDQWHAVGQGQDLVLPEDARDLAFEFTALSFQDPPSLTLRYRLLGYDRDWRDLQVVSPRAVNYTNLPSGSYTFEVMAANNAGVWNPTPARLTFRIKPHFHETILFFLLVATLLATIVYAGYRIQRRAHETQRTLLEQQVVERTQQLHAANLQLEHASQTDPLTGLRNRRYLANQIPADLAFYDREHARSGGSDHTLLLALVDVDHFKRINDTYGHKAGDKVLQQLAQVMTRLVRTGDYIVRWGGEEFLLVFRPMPRKYVQVIGERIRRSVAEQRFDVGGDRHLPVTCSVGMAEYPLFRDAQQQLGWEQMVELADAALFWVKEHGRNGWAVLRPTQQTELSSLIRSLSAGAQGLIDNKRLEIISSFDASDEQPR